MGFSVFQTQAVQPVRTSGLPTRLLNTLAPTHPGNYIIQEQHPAKHMRILTGIAGRKTYLVDTIRQYQLDLTLDILQTALDVLAHTTLVVHYLPTGLHSFSLLIRTPRTQVSVHTLTAAIKAACQPHKLQVTELVALLAMVSH